MGLGAAQTRCGLTSTETSKPVAPRHGQPPRRLTVICGSGWRQTANWDHFYNVVKGVTDNLKIWNYAKTDFSDRFQEGVNHAPDCTAAVASPALLWPPNNKFVLVAINGATDADGDALTLAITSIRQDEPVGKGNSAPDGKGVGTATAELRAEKLGSGDGRVYHVSFTASDRTVALARALCVWPCRTIRPSRRWMAARCTIRPYPPRRLLPTLLAMRGPVAPAHASCMTCAT